MTLGAGFIADEFSIYGHSTRMPALAGAGLVKYSDAQSKDQQTKNHHHKNQRALPNMMTLHNS
jgi:hypothetical protein